MKNRFFPARPGRPQGPPLRQLSRPQGPLLLKNILFLALLLAGTLPTRAQNPAPAKAQTQATVLTGGTVHVGNGQVIENAVVGFENGTLTFVGDATTPYDKARYVAISVAGKHVYPGLISMSSTIGLQEISAVRATTDFQEVGAVNPNVRALVAYNTDSDVIPTVRGNGVLLVQATPYGGLVSGESSVMELDGWNWEDAVLKADDGIHLTWPVYFARNFSFEDFRVTVKKNDKREETLRALDKTFNDALAYTKTPVPNPVNLKLEAMRGLYDGTKNLYVHADYGKEIIEAVQFAKAHGVNKVVIIGGEEAELATDILRDNQVPVVLGSLHRVPNFPEQDVDLPYKLPALLTKAGVTVALSYEANDGYWRQRNLPFLAGTAAAYGLTPEQALQLVTQNPARIMGIDQQVGTLEKGKLATLVVSTGDLLDMRGNNVELAFIRGKQLTLDDKQKQLYRKYQEKYGK